MPRTTLPLTHIKRKYGKRSRKQSKRQIELFPKRLLPPGATGKELMAELVRLNPKGDEDE